MIEQYSTREKISIDTPLNYVLLGVVSILFWIAGYAESTGYPVYGSVQSTPLWNTVCTHLPGKTVTYLAGFLLLPLVAFLVHRANYVLIIIREKTLMPFWFYLLFVSSNFVVFPVSSASLGIFCLTVSFYQILSSYNDLNEKKIGVSKAYNAALLIGLGSLLWMHLILFIPVFWCGMYMFRSLNVRTFLASLFGLGTVGWFLFGWMALTKDYTSFAAAFSSLLKFHWPSEAHIRTVDLLYIVWLAVPSTLSVILILLREYEDSIRTRQYLSFTMLLGFASLLFSFVCDQQAEEFLQVSCMPLGILSAHFFSVSKLKRIYIYYSLFVAIFILLAVMRSPWSFLPPDLIEY